MHVRPTVLAPVLVSVLILGLPAKSPGGTLGASPAHASGIPTVHSLHHLGPLVQLPGSLLPKLRSAHRLAPLEASRTLFEQQSFAEGWTSETIGGIFD